MGMYTELVFKAVIRSDVPESVRAVLNYLFNDAKQPDTGLLPDHEFFQCSRWSVLGKRSSYYHTPFALSRYSGDYIFSRSDLKNYDQEIEKFIAWVTPYLANLPGQCIGWTWYEEANEPTLLYMPTKENSHG